MHTEHTTSGTTRRGVLRGAAGLATTAVAAGAVGTAAAQEGGEPDFGGWMEDVGNYDGTVADHTGEGEVTVGVGTEGNGGNFAFGPPAIHVDPGTTIVFEWTGEGGGHNVIAEEGADFNSGDPVTEAGTTFEWTAEEDGIVTYYCQPHLTLGMKGAIVVGTDYPTVGGGGGGGGEGGEGGGEGTGEFTLTTQHYILGGALIAAVLSPIAFGLFLLSRAGRWREAPEPEYEPERRVEATAGPPVTEEAPEAEPVRELGHDDYTPVGTATLIAIYFGILVLMWVFVYFVEFLGRGPTVIG